MTNEQTQKQDFLFHIDQKVEMWTRSTKYIKADNLEEAEQIIKNQIKDGLIYEDIYEYDFLYDTQKDLDIIEIFNSDGNQIQ